MPEFVKVAQTDEIPPGQAKLVEVNGNEIALFNVGGTFHAIDNNCTHVGGPLCEGEISGVEVTCPWHGATFDVTTGHVLGPPAGEPLSRYNVRVEGPDIEIEADPSLFCPTAHNSLDGGLPPPNSCDLKTRKAGSVPLNLKIRSLPLLCKVLDKTEPSGIS